MKGADCIPRPLVVVIEAVPPEIVTVSFTVTVVEVSAIAPTASVARMVIA